MKMYTDEIQTAKLNELGFDKPKGWCVEGISSRIIMYKHKEDDEDFNYSIGELISFLPPIIPQGSGYYINITHDSVSWVIDYQQRQRCRVD